MPISKKKNWKISSLESLVWFILFEIFVCKFYSVFLFNSVQIGSIFFGIQIGYSLNYRLSAVTFWRNSLNNWVTSYQSVQTVKYDIWQIPEQTWAAGDVRTDSESNETTRRVPEQFAVDRNL